MHLAPGWQRLRHYDRSNLRGDVIGGITVTAYLVPQVMAYSALAGLPPTSGLWVIVVGFVLYAFVGSSRLLSVGPESSTALLTATSLAPLAGGEPLRYAALAASLALIVGALSLLAALLRLGFIGDLLGKPLLIGYMAGVGVLMISSQALTLTDTPGNQRTFIEEVTAIIERVTAAPVQIAPIIMALVIAALLLLLKRRFPAVPWPLILVAIAALITATISDAASLFPTVGTIPAGGPDFTAPALAADDLGLLMLPAVAILVVGYTDNLLTGRMLAIGTGQRIHKNQEFVALGVSNIGSSLVGGFPVSSSASRAVIARAAGARTQVYSLIAATLVLAIVLGLGFILESFPLAALSGLIIFAAVSLIDVAEFQRLWRFRRREFLLALLATVGVLAFGILYGIAIAVAVSVVDLLSRVARPHAALLGTVDEIPGWHSLNDYPAAHQEPGLLVFRYDSPLFFANAEDFLRRARRALVSDTKARWMLINVEAVSEVDITGLDALQELQRECADRGVRLGLVRVKSELLVALRDHGVLHAIGEEYVFQTMPTAVDAYRSAAQD
ncbi:MAG TPA: sulfate permease [Candidatus Nanopelagicales bacterium]|nr:sulfate permease [Candidatus Nanopelagicales bacterium]